MRFTKNDCNLIALMLMAEIGYINCIEELEKKLQFIKEEEKKEVKKILKIMKMHKGYLTKIAKQAGEYADKKLDEKDSKFEIMVKAVRLAIDFLRRKSTLRDDVNKFQKIFNLIEVKE